MNPPPSPSFSDPDSLDGAAQGAGWRFRLYTLLNRESSRAGHWFSVALMAAVVISVGVVVLDSVASFHKAYGELFGLLEWVFTLVFTAEYLARLVSTRRPARYALSALGIIDLLSILPTYLSVLLPGTSAFLDIRVLRLARIFRLLKLGAHIGEFSALTDALMASRRKIGVFLSMALLVALVLGTLMYVVEGPEHGFTNIPVGVYWAISTMTTVGYGDVVPQTDLGRFLSSVMMMLGWGTLAVPTGIVSAEITAQRVGGAEAEHRGGRSCASCGATDHADHALFCHRCGAVLPG